VLAIARRADLLDYLARECGERIETMAGDISDAGHRQALLGLGHQSDAQQLRLGYR
jgi:hypothetical protein